MELSRIFRVVKDGFQSIFSREATREDLMAVIENVGSRNFLEVSTVLHKQNLRCSEEKFNLFLDGIEKRGAEEGDILEAASGVSRCETWPYDVLEKLK